MDKICETPRPLLSLAKLNDVRLWLKVSQLSDIANDEGTGLALWAMYSPPAISDLKWSNRRTPTFQNLKLWRTILRNIFCSESGLYPRNLGPTLVTIDNGNPLFLSYHPAPISTRIYGHTWHTGPRGCTTQGNHKDNERRGLIRRQRWIS